VGLIIFLGAEPQLFFLPSLQVVQGKPELWQAPGELEQSDPPPLRPDHQRGSFGRQRDLLLRRRWCNASGARWPEESLLEGHCSALRQLAPGITGT
jgi:hypothetical protein